jgi:hypothetical protein
MTTANFRSPALSTVYLGSPAFPVSRLDKNLTDDNPSRSRIVQAIRHLDDGRDFVKLHLAGVRCGCFAKTCGGSLSQLPEMAPNGTAC